MLEELLKAILGGASAPPSQSQSSGDSMSDMLEAIMGGASGQQPSGMQQQAADPISSIMEAILGGASGQQPSGMQQQAADPISSILEAIMGGALQGGGQQQGSVGALGGGTNSFLGMIVSALAQKIGLPPQLAQLVVTFVLKKLLSGAASASQGGGYSGGGLLPSAPSADQGLDLDNLLEQMGRGQTLDARELQSTRMAEELSRETGLSPDVAAASLEEVLNMLSKQMGGNVPQGWSPQPSQPGSLEDLLDTW